MVEALGCTSDPSWRITAAPMTLAPTPDDAPESTRTTRRTHAGRPRSDARTCGTSLQAASGSFWTGRADETAASQLVDAFGAPGRKRRGLNPWRKPDVMNFRSTANMSAGPSRVATSPVRVSGCLSARCGVKNQMAVTAGVKRTSYFEPVVYRNPTRPRDVAQRIQVGKWTMVTGAPRAGLDLKLTRSSENFVDVPTTCSLPISTASPPARRGSSKPEHFGDPIAAPCEHGSRRPRVPSLWKPRSSSQLRRRPARPHFKGSRPRLPASGSFRNDHAADARAAGVIAEAWKTARLRHFGRRRQAVGRSTIDANITHPVIFSPIAVLPAGSRTRSNARSGPDGDRVGARRLGGAHAARSQSVPGDGRRSPPRDPRPETIACWKWPRAASRWCVRRSSRSSTTSRLRWAWPGRSMAQPAGGSRRNPGSAIKVDAKRKPPADAGRRRRVWRTRQTSPGQRRHRRHHAPSERRGAPSTGRRSPRSGRRRTRGRTDTPIGDPSLGRRPPAVEPFDLYLLPESIRPISRTSRSRCSASRLSRRHR